MTFREAITQFTRSGATIVTIVEGVDDEQACWKPAPDKWSVLEVVRHLADEERDDFRTRLDMTLHRPLDEWPPIDPEGAVTIRAYNRGDVRAAIADFAQERERSLAWLATLGEPDLAVEHTHPQFGSMSAGNLLTSWVVHDLLHIRQLAKIQYLYTASHAHPYTTDYAGPNLSAP